ncbi:hypothetical protein BsWGS_14856 [Bradybaena similaris]
MSKKKVEEKVAVYRTQSYWDLFDAIGLGGEDKVVEILNTTLDPKALQRKKDLQGLTPLKKAIALSKCHIARILVSYGAEPSIRDPLGRTVLHVAALTGRRELIAPLLVSSDSSVNVQDKEGWTPLHLAVRGQHQKAINWLLYAGADTSLKNKNDVAPIDMCDEENPIRQMLERQAYNLDECPVELCSAFIGPKQLNMIGSNGNLMFVTSSLWSEDMQFFFNVRIKPQYANPKFPLRQDEMFFNDVCRYRMMYRLPPGRSRVRAYFLSFEHFRSAEVILKVTSKTKFLGDVPVSLSTYTQDNFTCFLASAEIDLKDAGQFVLVKRSAAVLLTKGLDWVYSNARHPMFKFDLPTGALPGPPLNWESTRGDRAREEINSLIQNLQGDTDSGHNAAESGKIGGSDQAEADHTAAEDAEGAHEDAEGIAEETEDADFVASPQMLDGNEPDECDDFYFISKGWGLYLEHRRTLPLAHLLDKGALEKNIILCNSDFFRVFHTSGLHPKQKCRIQIPKTNDFVKVGTVLVYRRDELKPGEIEFPDPDDEADEHFISQDGKNVWGVYWLNKEKERWSLLPSGIANKKTRVIFETNRLSTFIVVQLKIGTQKWELESDEEASSEEESVSEKTVEVSEKPEEEGEDEAAPRESEPEILAKQIESEFEQKKAKKKKKEPDEFIVDYGDDDISVDENEDLLIDEDQIIAAEGEANKSPAPSDLSHRKTEVELMGAKPQAPGPEPQEGDATADKKNENASNTRRYNPEGDTNQNNNDDVNDNTSNKNNSATKRQDDDEDNNRNFQQFDEDADIENLAPEERTVFKNLEPATSNYSVVVGVPQKPVEVIPESPVEEKVEEVEGEEDEAEPEEVESNEDLPQFRVRVLSIAVKVGGKTVLQPVRFGPPLDKIGLQEADEAIVKNSIALMWRYRNHRDVTAAVFSRARDGGFDVTIELVRTEDLYVRAEHWWSFDYKMVSESVAFPVKSGRLFSFAMDGTMVVESPPGSSPGYIMTRSMYCYFSQINCLQYYAKRGGISAKEEEKGPKKGPKRKDEPKVESTEPDALLEITGYPRGTKTNGVTIVLMPVFLNGPDLWFGRHVDLRKSDDILLSRLVKYLRKESDLVKQWWKLIILLGYPEKMVEAEKGKNKSSFIVATYLKKWFDDNLNSRDRGILTLVSVLDTMGLESTITGVVDILKTYKAHLLTIKKKPRYLKLLFHWVLQTKITRNSLIRMIGPQIMKPISEIFLLRLSELVNSKQLHKIGACMEVEDNVINALVEEEVITDADYFPFRVFIKSRQKKDEIIHYTLLLMAMVKQCQEPEAKNFIVNETRKWMETVVDTDPEICAKLNNIFD